MKVEKIEKHMSQNTVVVGENGVNTTIGVITDTDRTDTPVRISGISVGDDYAHSDYNWFEAKRVRKATDEEIARFFFAWLREDGRDIANGFSRFGGRPPKGFEVAATTGEEAPEAGRVYGPEATQAERAALVGKRVALVGDYEGAQGVVDRVDSSQIPYMVKTDTPTGGLPRRWTQRVRLIEAAATPAPTSTEGRVYDQHAPEADIRALVGQMVEIVEASPSYHNGKIGRVLELYLGREEFVRVEVEGVPRGWWASKVRVVSAAPVAETKPALTQKARYEKGDRVQLRAARSGESRISPTFFAPGEVVTIVSHNAVENKYDAVGTTAHGGPHNQTGLKHADIAGLAHVSAPTATPATETRPVAKRLTIGDKAVAVYRSAPHMASIGTITRDDHDGLPYLLDGKAPMFREEHTFPLTVEGFRGAHGAQKAEGVVPENGDFVATFFEGEVRAGVLNTESDRITYKTGRGIRVAGDENLTDRVVVLCKAPKA